MDIKKIVLYLFVAVLAILLVNKWVKDYPPKSTPATTEQTVKKPEAGSYAPATFSPGVAAQTKKAASTPVTSGKTPQGRLIDVKTDVLDVSIDSNGGNVVSAKLLKYPVSLQEKNTPEQIISSDPETLYLAQSGLTNTSTKGKNSVIQFTSSKKDYVLEDGQSKVVVLLKGRTANGLAVTKTYDFQRDRYAVNVSYQVSNQSSKAWSGSLYTQFTRREPGSAKSHHLYTRSYNGGAISSTGTPYEKLTYSDMAGKNLDRTNEGGWVAMQQHYFLSAWIPSSQQQTHHLYSHSMPHPSGGNEVYVLGFVSPQMSIAPGATSVSSATLYVGPEIATRLSVLAPGLDHTIDYGWLYWVSVIIFWVMSKIHLLVRNWGWSIVITTIVIKMLFYPLTARSFRSMARMRELQPRLKSLKERYGDDRQAMSKATMELYRKEKINPLGGCLPMLIQVPVFIGLYYVLIESVQLRQAPFIFWIHDLSVKDPYYVLPILMGLSMLVQQWLTPTSLDPAQQKMMWILPIVFTVFFVNFPAGLVLYWLTNNVVQVLQQYYVTETFEKHKAKQKHKKKR